MKMGMGIGIFLMGYTIFYYISDIFKAYVNDGSTGIPIPFAVLLFGTQKKTQAQLSAMRIPWPPFGKNNPNGVVPGLGSGSSPSSSTTPSPGGGGTSPNLGGGGKVQIV